MALNSAWQALIVISNQPKQHPFLEPRLPAEDCAAEYRVDTYAKRHAGDVPAQLQLGQRLEEKLPGDHHRDEDGRGELDSAQTPRQQTESVLFVVPPSPKRTDLQAVLSSPVPLLAP